MEERGQLILRLKAPTRRAPDLQRWVGFLEGQPDDVDDFIDDIRGR